MHAVDQLLLRQAGTCRPSGAAPAPATTSVSVGTKRGRRSGWPSAAPVPRSWLLDARSRARRSASSGAGPAAGRRPRPVTTSIRRSKRSKPSRHRPPRLTSTCWCGPSAASGSQHDGRARLHALARRRAMAVRQEIERAEGPQARCRARASSSASPVTTTREPAPQRLAQQAAGVAQLVGRVEVEGDLGHRRSGRGLAARACAPALAPPAACATPAGTAPAGHGPAGGALGRPTLPGRAGDVQVRPRVLGREALQELGRRDGAAGRAGHVAHVGEVASSGPRRTRRPAACASTGRSAASPAVEQRLRPARRRWLNRPLRTRAQRDHAGAGQRGDVDHRRAA